MLFWWRVVGRKAKDETVAKVLQAFLERRTWRQADLRRRVDVGPKRMRAILMSLVESGTPLQREEEHPHVYWSVPAKWFPGGLALTPEEHADLLRCLLRLEAEPTRDALIEKVVTSVKSGTAMPVVSVGEIGVAGEVLSILEDAVRDRVAVDLRYRKTWRTVTPAHLELRPRPRLVAACHKAKSLRWFRLERVSRAVIALDTAPQLPTPDELAEFLAASVDGYHGAQSSPELWFEVAKDSADWVTANLPKGVSHEHSPRCVRVSGGSRGLEPLARFAVSLGDVALRMSPALASEVARIAGAALAVADGSHGTTARASSGIQSARPIGRGERLEHGVK